MCYASRLKANYFSILLLIYLVFFNFAKLTHGQMKTIKSPYLGLQRIEAKDPHVQLFQFRNVLNAHRDRLIHRVVKDLPRYLYCRFEATASRPDLDNLSEKLLALTRENVDLDKYGSIVDHFQRRSAVELTNPIFFEEIDSFIAWNFGERLRIAS